MKSVQLTSLNEKFTAETVKENAEDILKILKEISDFHSMPYKEYVDKYGETVVCNKDGKNILTSGAFVKLQLLNNKLFGKTEVNPGSYYDKLLMLLMFATRQDLSDFHFNKVVDLLSNKAKNSEKHDFMVSLCEAEDVADFIKVAMSFVKKTKRPND